VDYLKGRLMLVRSQWASAVELLEKARPALAPQRELGAQIDLFLGRATRTRADERSRTRLVDEHIQIRAGGHVSVEGREPGTVRKEKIFRRVVTPHVLPALSEMTFQQLVTSTPTWPSL